MIFISILVLSHFSHAWLFVTLWTVACQAPLSMMGLSRQEYWSGFPCPPPGESLWPRDQTHVSCDSCIAGRLQALLSHWRSPIFIYIVFLKFFSFLNFQCWDVTKKTRNSTPPSVPYFKGLKISEFAQIFLKYEYHWFLPSWEPKGHPWWFSG